VDPIGRSQGGSVSPPRPGSNTPPHATGVLVEFFRRPAFAEGAVFRCGTALHKLFFDPPGRYSEDIDLVQRAAGPIGPLVGEIRFPPWR